MNRVFILPNERIITQAGLSGKLEDELYELLEHQGVEAFPRTALEYLNDRAGSDMDWLRKLAAGMTRPGRVNQYVIRALSRKS